MNIDKASKIGREQSMSRQDIDEIDMEIQQRRGMEKFNNGSLSSTPYYIQELERKLDTVNYKLDMVLMKLRENEST